VLEGLGAGDAATLSHVPHHDDRGAALLGEAHQLAGALPHLPYIPRCALQHPGIYRLDRVDHHDVGANRADCLDNRLQPGLSQHVNRPRILNQPVGSKADLIGRLLTAGVEHGATGSLQPSRSLEQQGRFPNPRLPPDKGHRARNNSTPEHKIEFV
jgi:hypothetical protein